MSYQDSTSANRYSSPVRSNFAGAARPSTNPRIHALTKPYARPSSFSGTSTKHQISSPEVTDQRKSMSPTKQSAPSTRHSSQNGELTRSGSESSLSAGLSMMKSIFSRPLGWLATPSRGSASKRDSSSSFGHDMEEGNDSPTANSGLGSKQFHSNGDLSMYDPKHYSVTGRAITGTMLPPLPPNLSLSAKSQQPNEKPLPNRTTFSRPLPGSTSMPYLDPPSGLFSPTQMGSPKKSKLGMGSRLSRSSRLVDLGSLDADGDDEMSGPELRGGDIGGERAGTRKEPEAWSPWKETAQKRTSTPAKKSVSRASEARDYTLPSLSPFRLPQSPHRRPTPQQSGLARSSTLVDLNRASSVASDVSMGRSGSKMRGSGSMLFSTGANGDRGDDRMSVDGDKKDDSVLDWFMQDRWRAAGSPASAAASRRLGSVAPSTGMPPIRKGQMVWDAEKGFVRESELKASEIPKPTHSNDAERILFALESLRKTPLASARKSTPFASSSEIPPELIGSSSRQLRKAVAVPLATAQAGETARRKRDKDRLGDADSVMISPYGRRRQVDKAVRDERRQASEQASDYNPKSQTRSQSTENRSRSSSMVSDDDMVSEREPSPSPAPTPRRSTRNKRPISPPEESTPKARKTRSGKSAKDQPQEKEKETTTPKATPRKGRKKTSPPPEKAPKEPAPALPTITETAPSPASRPESTYQPGANSDSGRGSSSLRARNDPAHRRHQGAASYGSSRATSPNETSGRYSAREEDLPDMDELVQAKITLPPMSGISFSGLAGTPLSNTATPQPSIPAASVSPAKPAATLAVPNRPVGGINNRLSAGVSTRPRASSPLASGSIVAAPASPPSEKPKSSAPPTTLAPPKPVVSDFFAPPSGSTTPTTKPPASLFGSKTNGDSPEPAKKAFSFGLGKPPAQEEAATGVPDFFGKKSAPTSGTTTPDIPPPAKPFDFGLAAKQASEAQKQDTASNGITPTFNLGSSATTAAPASAPAPTAATTTNNGSAFSFGKPAETGAPTPVATVAPSSTPAFSFGSKPADPPAAAPAPSSAPLFGAKPAEPAKPAFSFGTTAKSPEPSASAPFSFGSAAKDTVKPPPAASSPFGGFSFSKPAETPKPAETATPAATAASTTAPAAPSTNGTFSFGSSGGFGTAKPTEPAKTFSFGANATSPQPAATPSFGGFGSTTGGSGFGTTPAAPTNGFGAAPSTGFSFGSTPSTGFGSAPAASTGFGAAPAATGFGGAPPSTGFGAAPATTTGFGSTPASTGFGGASGGASTTSTGFGGFGSGFGNSGAPAATTAPTTPSAAPATSFNFNQPAPAPAASGFGGFGQPPAAQNTSSSFSFGTPTSTQPSFSFGANPAPAAALTGFTFGSPAPAAAAPRFGSPAPTPASPSVEAGGFSLGMGNAEAPGSPSGRKIKPLRRTGTKR